MKTILTLIGKDFRLDWKRPWTILLFSALPLLMTTLISTIFGGKGNSTSLPPLHVAVLDHDRDLFSRILRSLPGHGDAANHLQLHFVDNREDGVRLLEERQASAFVVLPTNLTANLLDGDTNVIDLYENPAEQILPKIVRQGVSLLAVGLSGAAELLHEPLHDIREMIRSNDFPAEAAVSSVATASLENLRHLRTYLFPPLIQFKTIPAAEYNIATSDLTQTNVHHE